MDPPDRVGDVLGGDWTLEAAIGRGGMGVVYRARHRDGRVAAIKVLHSRLAGERGLVARFGREATLANKVDHPGVARVVGEGTTDDGCPYLVSELVLGETLEAERVRRGGALPAEEVKVIGEELLEVIAAAHARGVLHRDVKPQNVVRAEGGGLRVLDFGLARESEGSAEGVTSLDAVLGTVGFMAPEQAQGRWDLVDEATDVWAVGATLLKLATGLDAHDGETSQERLALAATKPVARVASRAPALDPALAEVIDRAMAYSRKERFGSASAMRAALRGGAAASDASSLRGGVAHAPSGAAAAGDPSSSGTAGPAPDGRAAVRRRAVYPVVAVGLALALAAGYAAWRPAPPASTAPATSPLAPPPPSPIAEESGARASAQAPASGAAAPALPASTPGVGLRHAPSLGRSAEVPVAAPASASAPAVPAPSTDPLDRRR